VEILEIPRLPAPPHTKLDMSGTRGVGCGARYIW